MTQASAHVGRTTLDGTVRVFLAEALLLPTGLLTVAFLTRRLGPSDYGLWALAATLVAWLEWSITSVFSRLTVKYIGDAENWRPVAAAIVRLHLIVASGVALLLGLAAAPLAALFDAPALAGYLRLFAVDLPLFSLAQAHRDILVGLGDFRGRALNGASRWIARLLLIVLLVQLGGSVQGAILGCIGASVVQLIIGRRHVQPALLRGSISALPRLWAYAAPLFLFAVSIRLFDKIDLFALKMLGGTAAEAGQYGAVQNLAIIPGVFALSFSPLLLATLTRTVRAGDRLSAGRLARDALRAVLWMLPFAGIVAGGAREIVELCFGPAFIAAAPQLGWLMFGAVALVMISVGTAMLTAAGKPGWTFALTGPLVLLAAGCHVVAIPRWGPLGAAMVTSIVAGLGALATILAVRSVWQVLPPVATMIRALLATAFVWMLALYWPIAIPFVLLKYLVLALVVPCCFLALGEWSPAELALARSLVQRRTMPRPNSSEPI